MAWNKRQAATVRRKAELGAESELDRSRLAAKTQMDVAKMTNRAETQRRKMQIAADKESRVPVPMAETPYLPESRERGHMGDIMRASPQELGSIYEGMPEMERPIHAIRGTRQSYWSPGTRQEYGDLRTAMTGFRQRPEKERAGAVTGGGMTAYQSAQTRQKKEEAGFKMSQAELDHVDKAVRTIYGSTMDIGKMPTEAQLTNTRGRARVEFIKAHYPPEEAKKRISRIPTDLMRDKETGEVHWENIYGEPVTMGGGEMEAETGGVEGYEPAPLPEAPTSDFDYRGMTNSGLRSRSVNAGKLYSGQKEKDSSRYAMGRGAEALGRGGGAVAKSVKGGLRDWLKKGNTQIDYPFNRSMMGSM